MRVPTAEEQPTVSLWPEAGQALGISKTSAYEWARRGDIPVIRLGRRVLVPTAALRRLLQLDEPTHAA